MKKKGSKSVSMLTGRNAILRCMVMLCALDDSTKLCPCVIFKHKALLSTPLQPGIAVRAEDNSWMNSDVVSDWIRAIWEKAPHALLAR